MSSISMSLMNPLLSSKKELPESVNSIKNELPKQGLVSFLTLAQSNFKVYRFLVLMGMVRVDDSFVYSGISKKFVLFWNYLLGTVLAIYVIPQLFQSIMMMYSWHQDSNTVAINFTWVVILAIQVSVIWFGVFYLRRAIREPQSLNREWYLEAFEYSLPICQYVLFVVCSFTLICLGVYIIWVLMSYAGYSHTISMAALSVVGFEIFATIGGSCYLVGSLFVLMVEQRISLMTMKRLVSQVRDCSVTHAVYFATRNEIKSREERLPINLVVFAALLNTVLGIILLLLYISLTDFGGVVYWVFTIFLELSAFGRELIILLVLLFEIVKVNDQAQVMIGLLAECEWSGSCVACNSGGESVEITGDVSKVGPSVTSRTSSTCSELVRQSVFIACIGKPIGSTIFYKKPTRNHILLQIASSIVVTLIAMLKAYFLSKEHEP